MNLIKVILVIIIIIIILFCFIKINLYDLIFLLQFC